MKRLLMVVVIALSLVLLFRPWQSTAPPTAQTGLRLAQLMGSEQGSEGYLKAQPGQPLHFPEDHWQHSGFQNEWWYLTANLQDRNDPNIRFGVQMTLFRFALTAAMEASAAGESLDYGSANPWLSPNIYMAHFAITHGAEDEHRASQRFSRQGPGLAGAKTFQAGGQDAGVTKIWLADWQLRSLSQDDLFPLQMQAVDAEQNMAASLSIKAVKARVLQGEQGFSRKNNAGGGSYYYSYPRLSISGSLTWDQREYEVSGLGWFDHEWSSNSLTADQAGWDWFSIQLDDGSELMYYRFRNHDGSDGLQHLTRISAEGKPVQLDPAQLKIKVVDQWRSSSGTVYPSKWRLQLPSQGLDLTIEPLVMDQLMDLSVSYWEGAVQITGSHQGHGYVELAGYE